MIIPSQFDFPRGDGFSTYQNFIQAWMLILNFDGGDYSIQDFENRILMSNG